MDVFETKPGMPAPGGPMGGPGGAQAGGPPLPPGMIPVVLPDLDWDHMTLDWAQYQDKWELSEDGTYYGLRFVYFATKILSRDHQYMNIYVPAAYLNPDGTVNENGTCGRYTARTAPVILYNGCGGWMSSTPGEARLDYLAEGFVHVSVGARSRNGGYVGKAPSAAVDQKAAIRMLRLHDAFIPGDKNRAFSCGGSGGGQMSSVFGASGNMKQYYPYLYEIGAAGIEKNPDGTYTSTINDDVYGSQCYCPISDVDHADLAFSWFHFDDPNISLSDFSFEGEEMHTLSPFRLALQDDLAQGWAEYINSIGLENEQGEPLTFPKKADGTYDLRAGSYYTQYLQNLSDCLNKFLKASTYPDGTVHYNALITPFESEERTYASVDDYLATFKNTDSWLKKNADGSYTVTSLPAYVQGTGVARGKDTPGFDTFHCTDVNDAFGHGDERAVHFSTAIGGILEKNYDRYKTLEEFDRCDVDAYISDVKRADIAEQVYLYNATTILLAKARGMEDVQPARFWRTREGTADIHSFGIDYDMCMAARLAGAQVDYSLVWGAGHGDVDGDGTGTFAEWVHSVV